MLISPKRHTMTFTRIIILSVSVYLLAGCSPDPIDNPPSDPVNLRDTTILNMAYGSNPSQKLDLGLPASRTGSTSLVIVVHGGGWATGDKAELTWLLNGLKQRGFAVANINYRLTLNTTDNYKMQLDDIDSAVQFSLRQSSVYTFNSQKIYIAGHSAGGHLSLCFAYTRNTDGKVKSAVSLAGPTDLYGLAYYNNVVYNSVLTPFLGMPLFPINATSEQRYKSCSPVNQAATSSPPTLFFHGELDPVVAPDQSSSMYSKLGSLGVDRKLISYPLTFHDWWTNGTLTTNTLDEMKTWFNSHP